MENDLLKRSASFVREAALKAAEDVTKERNKDLAAFIAQVMSPLAAAFLSAWCTQFVLLCLQALSDEHQSAKMLKVLQKLVAGPLNTGLLQLRTALSLESNKFGETREQSDHKISRYRDALNSFDEALALADENEKPTIHLYRAFVSTKIPGAEKEARVHASEFGTACKDLAQALIRKASVEEADAANRDLLAARIVVDRGAGGGGGLVGMSMAADKLKKSQLEFEARTCRANAKNFRREATELEECAVLISSLLNQ